MRIVWRWKANISNYVGKDKIVGVYFYPYTDDDNLILGRDGWVGFIEED